MQTTTTDSTPRRRQLAARAVRSSRFVLLTALALAACAPPSNAGDAGSRPSPGPLGAVLPLLVVAGVGFGIWWYLRQRRQ